MEFENALGRLFALLTAYEEARPEADSIRNAWSSVLSVQPDDVALELSTVASQVLPAARQQVRDANNAHQSRIWNKHEREWFAPFLHEHVHMGQPPSELPAHNVDYLAGVWTGLLSAGVSEGPLPTEEEVDGFLDELARVRGLVEQDKALDPRVQDAMVRRLNDLVWTLRHLERTGPSGVQEAVSRILGDILLQQQVKKSRRNPTLIAVGAVAWAIYTGFTPYADFKDSAKELTADVRGAVETVYGEIVEHDPAALPAAEEPPAITDGKEADEEEDEPPAA